MAIAVERIVLQASPQDKKSLVAKAKRLDLPLSELMRRGALAYHPAEDDDALAALADAARAAAENAGASIDDAIAFIDASDRAIERVGTALGGAAASAEIPTGRNNPD